MTITINMPIFPLRKEIAERRKRMEAGLPGTPFRRSAAGKSAASYGDARYSRDGLEFDVTALGALPQGTAGR